MRWGFDQWRKDHSVSRVSGGVPGRADLLLAHPCAPGPEDPPPVPGVWRGRRHVVSGRLPGGVRQLRRCLRLCWEVRVTQDQRWHLPEMWQRRHTCNTIRHDSLWPSEDFSAYSIILKSKIFALRYCGDFLPDDIISTGERFFCRCIFLQPRRTFLLLIEMYSLAGNVMTLKFLSDASVTAGGFQLKYNAIDASKVPRNYSNYFNWAHRGKLAFLMCTVHLLIFIFLFFFKFINYDYKK